MLRDHKGINPKITLKSEQILKNMLLPIQGALSNSDVWMDTKILTPPNPKLYAIDSIIKSKYHLTSANLKYVYQ